MKEFPGYRLNLQVSHIYGPQIPECEGKSSKYIFRAFFGQFLHLCPGLNASLIGIHVLHIWQGYLTFSYYFCRISQNCVCFHWLIFLPMRTLQMHIIRNLNLINVQSWIQVYLSFWHFGLQCLDYLTCFSVFQISELSQVKNPTRLTSYMTRQSKRKLILIWSKQWELHGWNSFS